MAGMSSSKGTFSSLTLLVNVTIHSHVCRECPEQLTPMKLTTPSVSQGHGEDRVSKMWEAPGMMPGAQDMMLKVPELLRHRSTTPFLKF